MFVVCQIEIGMFSFTYITTLKKIRPLSDKYSYDECLKYLPTHLFSLTSLIMAYQKIIVEAIISPYKIARLISTP